VIIGVRGTKHKRAVSGGPIREAYYKGAGFLSTTCLPRIDARHLAGQAGVPMWKLVLDDGEPWMLHWQKEGWPSSRRR
jgi:hypothetical protein